MIEVLYGFPSARAQCSDRVTIKKEDDRRGALRITLPKPVPATLSGFEGKLLEISLIGCLVEHVDRVLPKARLPLRFKWRGSEIRIEVTVIRSEMRIIFGRPAYVSGLEFCASQEESPQVVREIVGWLTKQAGSPATAPGTEPSGTPAAPPQPPPPAPPAPEPPPAKAAPAVPPPLPPAKPAPAVLPEAPTPPPFFKPEVAASRPAPPKPATQRARPASPATASKTVSAPIRPAPAPPPAATASVLPADQEEVEILSADYLQCTFNGREWVRVYVSDPAQPANGFTVLAPSDESEVDVLCRAYAKADAGKRLAMRQSFELAIARNRR